MLSKFTALLMTAALPIFADSLTEATNILPKVQEESQDLLFQSSFPCHNHENTQRGRRGRRGRQGPGGPTGANGVAGQAGPTGPTVGGTVGGTLIPFASEDFIGLAQNGGPETRTGAVIGFGFEIFDLPITNPLDYTNILNGAFSVIGDYTLTDMSANYTIFESNTQASDPGQITAQLYISTANDNIFTAIPGAVINFGTLPFPTIPGSIVNGSTSGLSIPIPSNTRLLLVFAYSTTYEGGQVFVYGPASAGIRLR